MKIIYILAPLLSLISFNIQAAEIQKWVDENGRVFYGDTPPASVKTETVRTSKRPSKLGKPLPRLSTTNTAPTSNTNKDLAKTTNDLEPEQAREACKTAKEDLKVIQKSARIQLRSADGSLRYMTKEEIKQRLERTKSDIQTFCQ